MHIKSLKVFCDVVVRKSFSLAAEVNEISQSNASQMVQQLEERLQVRLLDRSKRPFVLTPEGEIFYEGCRKIVQRYWALEEEVRTLHEEVAGRVSIASIYSVGLSHMTRFVREFMAKHPKANVHLQYQHPDRVYELVESGQVDLGLVSYAKGSKTLRALTWREEEMVLVCAPSHNLATRRVVKLEDLHGRDMVSFDDNLEIRRAIDRALSARRVETVVVMEFDNIEILKRAIELDAGISLLPRPTVEREVASGSLVAIPLADIRLVRPLGIIHARDKNLSKTARRFIQLLREQPPHPDGASNDAGSQSHSRNGRVPNGHANGK